jgi:hypothetical protein
MGKIKQEVYQSSTLGPIPLSFTGRHLLQSLREAIEEMVGGAVKQAQVGGSPIKPEWEPVSEARGKLAQYMSLLEQGKLTPECEGCEHPHPYVPRMNTRERNETDAEMYERLGTDAYAWACEFRRRARGEMFRWDTLVEVLQPWFANAIEKAKREERNKARRFTPAPELLSDEALLDELKKRGYYLTRPKV